MFPRTASDVQEIVLANRFRIRIGQEWKCIARFAAQVLGLLRTVNADGDRTNARVVELLQIFLDAS